ncbi:hypothetical protein IC229_31810 [Spirosoma sp. BT702]|uniref:Ig-like domain-containing protein n=1 Tax=Spirosoma profusum TaxID=2771354 RepID=A0A927GA94_9BACT|nr:choice-of-anchor Q domain-containing protein [Spirosoma profusum]MBD2705248.1 hypothetical protein [Spirosoma profusum]
MRTQLPSSSPVAFRSNQTNRSDMTSRWALGSLMLVWLLACPQWAVGQTIRYVKPTASGTGDGSSWANASSNLQAILDASAPTHQVWIAGGTYKPGGPANTDRTISFYMREGVAIYGGFVGNETSLSQRPARTTQPSSTTLSGDIGQANNTIDNSYSVIRNGPGLSPAAILDGVVITGGNGSAGGGVLNDGRTGSCRPTFRNCNFVANYATFGGAVFNDGFTAGSICSPILINCSLVSNSASEGGALYNQAGSGGTSSPILINCSFLGNNATNANFGGAMYNNGGGGGTSSPSLVNCSFRSNTAGGFGNALYSYGTGGTAKPDLTNCVVFGTGGNRSFSSVNATVVTRYSLLEASALVMGVDVSGPGNLTTTSSPFSPTGVSLQPCSPAINAGNTTSYTAVGGPSTDLSGQERPWRGSPIDMGALEYQTTPSTIGITQQPPSGQTVCAGASVTIPYSWSGIISSRQWYLNNNPIATPPTEPLMLSNVQPAQSGRYYVVVSSSCNSVTSTVFSLSVNVAPSRLYVKANATGTNTGLDWANAFTDLQSALNYGECPANLTEIWVAAGVYKPTTDTTRSVSFSMPSGVAIYGGFVGNETTLAQRPIVNPIIGHPSNTTLSGNIGDPAIQTDNSYHVIKNLGNELDSTAVLDGFVIKDGYGVGLVGRNTSGAGILNVHSSPTLVNCSLESNQSSLGGAMATYNASSPTLTNCSFINNTAQVYKGHGGAIYNEDGSIRLTNCSLEANRGYYGGAIALAATLRSSKPNVTLINCRLTDNYALTHGGALYNADGSLTLLNCSLQNNRSRSRGGACYNDTDGLESRNISLTNCSLQGNYSPNGGATYIGSGTINITNSVLWDNGSNETFGGSQGNQVSYSLLEPAVVGYINGGNNLMTTTSPFVSPTPQIPSELALRAGSPALNVGSNAAYQSVNGPATDLAGNVRIQQTTIDLGAFEGSHSCANQYSLKVGNWNDTDVWSCGRIPLLTDVVTLNHTVSLPTSYQGQALKLIYSAAGRLLFSSGSRLKLGGN